MFFLDHNIYLKAVKPSRYAFSQSGFNIITISFLFKHSKFKHSTNHKTVFTFKHLLLYKFDEFKRKIEIQNVTEPIDRL